MNNLTVVNEQTMTSREIAELTGKRHDHVMRDIREIIERLEGMDAPRFGESEYQSDRGKTYPEFLLDYEATMLLLTGYSIKLRAKVIRRWHELEKRHHQHETVKEALTIEQDAVQRFESYKRIGELFGVSNDFLLISVNQTVSQETGIDFMKKCNAQIILKDKEILLTPTDIGKGKGGLSGKAVNALLYDCGYQQPVRDSKGKLSWALTDKGREYAEVLPVGKKKGDGAPVLQIKWKGSILNEL